MPFEILGVGFMTNNAFLHRSPLKRTHSTPRNNNDRGKEGVRVQEPMG